MYGADVYSSDAAASGVVDLGEEETANDGVWSTYTWSFAMHLVAGDSSEAVVGLVGSPPTEVHTKRWEEPG